ncbi:MAG: hypothetical protein ACO1PN_05945 [Betaproteobacteria bacterium]
MALHALGDVRADYRTSTEIADASLQNVEVPFRTGHHLASRLTDYGRGKGLKLREIPFTEVARIYEEQAKAKLPLTEKEFREVISAETMVFGRKGLGGPQVKEVGQALAFKRLSTDANTAWLLKQKKGLTQFQANNEKGFTALAI